MNRLLCLALIITTSLTSNAQLLKKVPVGKSGCSVYAFCTLTFTEPGYSQDSSLVYTSECISKDSVNYGVICVKLKAGIDNLDNAEGLLISYMDYLKTSFNISKSAGYGKGHQLAKNENTRGVIDYWEDTDKNSWKVKGWTDGKFIAVLYGYSLKELPEQKLNLFLDGFRFPGM